MHLALSPVLRSLRELRFDAQECCKNDDHHHHHRHDGEGEDEAEAASSAGRHAPPLDAAQTGTSSGTPRPRTWQHVPSLDALHVAHEAKEDAWSRTT